MSAEFSLGRAGRSDAIGAFKNTGASKKWWGVGLLAILASYFILWFYTVVAGWTIEYFWQSLTGNLYHPVDGDNGNLAIRFTTKMNQFITTGWNPLINTYIAIIINLTILIIGVQKGIERLSNILMPLLLLFCP